MPRYDNLRFACDAPSALAAIRVFFSHVAGARTRKGKASSRKRCALKASHKKRYYSEMLKRILLALGALSLISANPAFAQTREAPYWATIKTEELNMRVGPSREYPIEWVYKRKGLPIKVIRLVDGWRLIQDSEGAEGWVSSSLLSPKRGAVVVGEGLAAMRDAPSESGGLKWNAEPGVVGVLGDCQTGWCEFDVAGRVGWVSASRLWGTGEP